MNKKFEKDLIIEIEGGWVVVDNITPRDIADFWYLPDGAWAIAKNTNQLVQQKGIKYDVRWHDRIVCSIGKRIEGVPLIELPDEAKQLALKEYPVNVQWRDDFNDYADENFEARLGFEEGYKANPKQYTEADMINAMALMAEEMHHNGMGPCSAFHHKARGLWDNKKNMFKSLQKVPISVCLLMENGVPLQENRVIKPVEINYE